MKLLLALVVAFAAMFVGASTAGANPPPPECQGNPHFCHGGDTIVVEVEPPGENCPNGGIKITVTHPGEEPESTKWPDEPPPPTTEVFFICNGEDGLPGEPGEPGIPGPTGPPGGTVISPSAFPNVTQTTTVNVSVSVGNGRGCKSIRKRARLVLPVRMRSENTVRVKVDRERAISKRVVRDRFVRVNMRGKRCGAHLVQVRKRGLDPTLRLWTVTSPTGIHKRVLVP